MHHSVNNKNKKNRVAYGYLFSDEREDPQVSLHETITHVQVQLQYRAVDWFDRRNKFIIIFVFADVLYDGCQLICTGTICTVYLLNNRNNT
jgi:hypothetical protein